VAKIWKLSEDHTKKPEFVFEKVLIPGSTPLFCACAGENNMFVFGGSATVLFDLTSEKAICDAFGWDYSQVAQILEERERMQKKLATKKQGFKGKKLREKEKKKKAAENTGESKAGAGESQTSSTAAGPSSTDADAAKKKKKTKPAPGTEQQPSQKPKKKKQKVVEAV